VAISPRLRRDKAIALAGEFSRDRKTERARLC